MPLKFSSFPCPCSTSALLSAIYCQPRCKSQHPGWTEREPLSWPSQLLGKDSLLLHRPSSEPFGIPIHVSTGFPSGAWNWGFQTGCLSPDASWALAKIVAFFADELG